MLYQNLRFMKGRVVGCFQKKMEFLGYNLPRSSVFGSLSLIGLAIMVFFCVPPAQGGIHTWVDGRFYMDTSSNYTLQSPEPLSNLNENSFAPTSTVMYGDMVFNFYQDDLPYGSQIKIIYGLGGIELNGDGEPGPISWEKSASVDAQPIGPYVWSANIATPLTQIEGRRKYSKLQFCVRITLPSGVTYDAERCVPPTFQLEAQIPWETSPQVNKQNANWRRLILNHTHPKNP